MKKNRDIWKRTGVVEYNHSYNKGGVIQYSQEVNQKGHTKFVMTGYTTIIKDEEKGEK